MSVALRAGRYCQHGAVVPGPIQHMHLAQALVRKDFGTAIAICVDWCDECTGIGRRVSRPQVMEMGIDHDVE